MTEIQEQQDLQEQLDHRAPLDLLALKEHLGQKVTREILEHKVFQ